MSTNDCTYKIKCADRTGENDTPVDRIATWDDGEFGVLEIPQRVHGDQHAPNDNHGDHRSCKYVR